jgi:hypothetical protein
MGRAKEGFMGRLGIIILCLVVLFFFAVVKCQPDFFQNFAPVF